MRWWLGVHWGRRWAVVVVVIFGFAGRGLEHAVALVEALGL
jgi:hypothetical protein